MKIFCLLLGFPVFYNMVVKNGLKLGLYIYGDAIIITYQRIRPLYTIPLERDFCILCYNYPGIQVIIIFVIWAISVFGYSVVAAEKQVAVSVPSFPITINEMPWK